MPPNKIGKTLSPSSSGLNLNAQISKHLSDLDDAASSFPGIWKKPSSWEKKPRTAVEWLETKKEDDNIGNFWRVHDKLYNLEEFAARHPGGSQWITLTRGTDITEAFEASHSVNIDKVEKTLGKFYVKEANTRRLAPYTFHENGFFKTLKKRAEPILQKVGTDSTFQIKLMQDALSVLALCLVLTGVWSGSTWTLILGGLVLSLAMNAAHNFFHMRTNWRTYYFDLSFLSSHEWQISHVLSHHLYPNTVMDSDIVTLHPRFKYLPSVDKTWWDQNAPIIFWPFLFCIFLWESLIGRIVAVASGTQSLRPENLIVFLQIPLFVLITGSLANSLISWIILHTATSFFFVIVGINSAHHHPEIFHDGDETRLDPDFGLCQLDATRDRAEEIQRNLLMAFVTFGEHSLHHLFPAVCLSKLHHLREVYEKTLEEFQEEFGVLTQWQLFMGGYQQIRRTTPNTR